MRPAWMNVWLVAALMLLLGVVPLPQMVFAGNSTVITGQQWERVQQKQQLIGERFDKLLQQARVQRELMMAWHKKARLQWQYPDELVGAVREPPLQDPHHSRPNFLDLRNSHLACL